MNAHRSSSEAPRRALALRVIWAIAVVVSLGLMALVIVRAVSGLDIESIEFGWIVVAAALFGVSWVTFALAWVTLNPNGTRTGEMARWVHSQLLRYLPGAIWAPMARATAVPGARGRRVATVAVEALIFLASAAAVGGLLGGVAVDPMLLLVCPAPLVALGIVRLGASRFDISTRSAAAAMLWLVPAWVLYGLASGAAQAAVGTGPSLAAVGAASLLAWAVGFVAVFAPGGAGVREVVYGAVLSGTASRATIAGGAVAARLAFTAGELLVAAALGWWVARRRSAAS